MIQENQILNTVLEEGQSQASIGMSLDMESAQVLMQMLSKNLYSDPIGSTIRECASNALDSHRRSGSKDPIIVSLKVNEQSNYEFSVEDFGTGLDADDVENIISKYGKSTKRNTNNELGMMGLGFKSPLAYSSSFFFVCRKDGVERKYTMYEGEDVNTIDLLYEAPTDQPNGVKVIVPVKYQDRNTFFSKIKNQLAYFENVYFDVNVNNNLITNSFNIHRSTHFQLSDMNTDTFVHICLDNVYYPLDFSKLGITPIKMPIGLRFNLSDGLFPTPNREQLIYSSTAIKIINEKLALVADIFVEKYNEKSLDCKNIHEIFKYYASPDRWITIAGTQINVINISGLSKKVFKKPQYAQYTNTDFHALYKNREYMFYGYKNHMQYSKGRFMQLKSSWDTKVSYNQFLEPHRLFTYDEKFVGNKKSYIKSLLPPSTYESFKFMRKDKEFSLFNKDNNNLVDNYVYLLALKRYPKDQWRVKIQEFQSILKEFTKDIRDVDSTQISQAWLDARKKTRIYVSNGGTKKVKLQGEINCRRADMLQRYVNNKSSKLTPSVIAMDKIESTPNLFVYGREKNDVLIDQLYSVSSKQKITYLVLSERECKVVEKLDLHNFISIENFMEGDSKPFRRIITSYLTHKLIEKYSDTFNKRNVIELVSKSMYEHMNILLAYHDANYYRMNDEDIYKAMLVIAENHNLFDEVIYTEYKQMKELLDTFPFIETAMDILPYSAASPENKHQITMLTDLFKYHRIRIDYTNYNLKLNTEEQLTVNIN